MTHSKTFTIEQVARSLQHSDAAPVWVHGSAMSVCDYVLRTCIGLNALVAPIGIDLGNGYILVCQVLPATPTEAPR